MAKHASDEHLTNRVTSEYLEMPGLQLTGRQAQRLFGLDGPQCERILAALVASGFLVLRTDGRYARVTEGHSRSHSTRHQPTPRLRMSA